MKNYFILFVLLISICALGFSEEMDANDAGEKDTETYGASTLNINFREFDSGGKMV